ncbi:MAG: hypothetical protein U9R50_01795 [Campylobacterota bacterium]|nr:hypothetical protein [Campylobacterota bacterium]
MRIISLLLIAIALLYAEIKVQKIKTKKLDEASGLLVSKKYPDVIWSHNDSGDKPRLYALDAKTLKLIKKIKVKKANHIDWEDMTYHRGNIVIGDFGNNKNKRDDLTLYTIEEPNPYKDKKVKIIAKQKFIFSDQKKSRLKRKNFDCEAMFSFNNELFLLTKHRADSNTTLYQLKGDLAQKLLQYSLDDRVTSADSDGKKLVILTRRSLYLLEPRVEDAIIFDVPMKRIELDDAGQIEGVALDGERVHVVSEEGNLYTLHVKDFK